MSSIAIWCFAALVFGLIRIWGIETIPAFERVLPFSLTRLLQQITVIGFASGIPFGIVDILLQSNRLHKRKYWHIIALKSAIQVLIALFAMIAMARFSLRYFEDIELSVAAFVFSPTSILWVGYSAIVSIIIYFVEVIKQKIGGKVLLNLLLGKYYTPRIETRIFQFLDMKDSTTHAENLGHVRFSSLIQDCFSDLTSAIIKHKVEVYQYVGDEAVLTWHLRDGFENANCIQVYYSFMDTINKKKVYYENRYGFVPFFKAGVHLGDVTVSEVGVIKREIAYHSDVLNTAARIQSRCNEFNAELLVSDDLKTNLEKTGFYNYEHIGGLALKGKNQPVNIYKVTLK
jgi:adenylate cyclase